MDEGEREEGGARLDLRLEPRAEAAAEARASIRERFSRELPPGFLDDLLTVVTELLTNSVRHGPGAPIELCLEMTPEGVLRGEVEDQGRGEVAIREIAKPGTGGLGLRMVDSIAERWGVYEGSTHVWFELRLPSGPAEPGSEPRR